MKKTGFTAACCENGDCPECQSRLSQLDADMSLEYQRREDRDKLRADKMKAANLAFHRSTNPLRLALEAKGIRPHMFAHNQ